MRKIEYSLIGLVAVFTAVVLPVFNEGHTMDFGTTSDIVSALCNVAMASAAVYAALQAKKWFDNKKFELGHSSAKDLFLTLFKMNPVLDNLSTHVEMFHASSETTKDIAKIEKILLEFYSLISDYEKSIFELNGVGWRFRNKYSDIYNLPVRVDIDIIPLAANFEAVIYLHDLDDNPENAVHSGKELENEITKLSDIIEQYNNSIATILNDSLQYELYFQFENSYC